MKKAGFLGCGRMASALVRGILRSGVAAPADIMVFDVVDAQTSQLENELGVRVAQSAGHLAGENECVVLAVKPQDADAALTSARDSLGTRLLVSIVAGFTLERIGKILGPDARVVRVMPNTPCLLGKGASAFSCSDNVNGEDRLFVSSLFGAVGLVTEVPEKLLDAVTGLGGSGPAYAFLMIEALADGGVRCGLPRHLALQFAAATVEGAAAMVLQTGEHPAVLRDRVTSPGGTTAAGLEALEAGKVRSACIAAVKAATERSIELRSA